MSANADNSEIPSIPKRDFFRQNPWNSFLGDCSAVDQYLLDKPVLSTWFVAHYANAFLRGISQVYYAYHIKSSPLLMQ